MKGRYAARPVSGAELHRAWLELVDTDGPFLAVPALKRVWPQGMPQLAAQAKAVLTDRKPDFEKAWEAWDRRRDEDSALTAYRQQRDAWVDAVLRGVLGWGDSYTTDFTGPQLAAIAPSVRSPDHSVTTHATGELIHGDTVGALVLVVDPVDSLREPLDDGWATSPIDRMEELLRTAGVPVGVVTDGRWWAIVSARPNTMLASGAVDAQTWIEEPATRNAFIELLQRRRLVGGKPEDRLTELFGQSVAAAEEITEALGVQVRRAVELLVQAFSEAGLDARDSGDPDPLPDDRDAVYQAAVTVMMRVVFLLFAEERGLLPQSRLFAMGYGISDEMGRLDQRAREEGTEALDATHLTWHRLLATSQALYQGASFEDMRLPSYGGSLFDPSRFTFLLQRNARGALAITVSDRVMLEVLRAVQMAQLKGEPARPISFRDIDVEQIGYIYEGLLGYSCAQVDEVTVGLIGKAGAEPEISLARLEELTELHESNAKVAEATLADIKAEQPAAVPPSKAALVKALASAEAVEDAERALLAVTTDAALRDRLRPFIGVIRRDLRNRPLVVQSGGLIVIETPSRATAGAHYTPRSLAEEVVEHALKPLVFQPGPYDTPDPEAWKPLSSDRLLDLKVADIACGSGAFLVAAARYLAARLVEAWHREGVAAGPAHDLHTRAIRQVVANCLYGADINAMAVEMCKLSLWLVSLDPKLPFSFVDDKVLHGNSLLGLTDIRQLEALHIDPKAPSDERLFDLGNGARVVQHLDVRGVLGQAASLRRRLATEIDDNDPQRSATTKRRQWREYQELTRQIDDIADGVIAAGLAVGGKPGQALSDAYENLRIAVGQAYPGGRGASHRTMLEAILAVGLEPRVQTDYERWNPLHWCLAVPDVMEQGGFDGIIGNPPFLGRAKLSGAVGANVREWLVQILAGGQSGAADLVAYFVLRASALLKYGGTLGLIATNTVAQGDTRQVGLDRLVATGFQITRSIQSRSWPAKSANLEYAAIWGTTGPVASDSHRVSDGELVARISTLLEPTGRVSGHPVRLVENAGLAYLGIYVHGAGFVIPRSKAAEWMALDASNAEVLFPFLNGEDLNSRPDCSGSRWVIDFNDRGQPAAEQYELPFQHVEEAVRPTRMKASKAVREAPWWLFWRARPAMRKAIANLDEVLVMAQTSNTLQPLRLRTGPVFSHKVIVFASDSYELQGWLSSSAHYLWARRYSSSLRKDLSYTPSDSLLTLCRPKQSGDLAEVGKALDIERTEIMLRRGLGLTKLYNLVHDPGVADSSDKDVARLRQIHVELDEAVMDAYGWGEVPLGHGFHTYRQMERWTVSPAARVEILDRLLEENQRRAAAQGSAVPTSDEDELDEAEDEA